VNLNPVSDSQIEWIFSLIGLIELMLNIPLDTKQLSSETLFPANLLASTEEKVKKLEMKNTKPRLT